MKIKQLFLLLSILMLSQKIFSQDFSWTAQIKNTNDNGFVNIWLSPEINSKLTPDFKDLRIYTSDNKEVPYIQQSEKARSKTIFFKEYKIIEKKHIPGKAYTRIVIHNPEKKLIDNISVIVKNANVKKWLKLNGSDDNKTFYVLNNNYIYNSSPSENGTSEIRVLHFPNTDYEYLELLVSDYFDKPINVLKVGYYDTETENGLYSDLKISSKEQTENKDKQESIFKFSFDEAQYIDRLDFNVKGPTYYKRSAQLFVETEVWNKKKNENIKQWQSIDIFEINSYSNTQLLFDKLNAQKLKLVIENEDNEALTIDHVSAMQLSKYLVAELKKDETYTLKFGDKKLRKAKYDLQYFADSIDNKLPLVKIQNLQKIEKKEIKPSQSIFNSMYIWVVLALVVIGLAYMSFKMMKETEGR